MVLVAFNSQQLALQLLHIISRVFCTHAGRTAFTCWRWPVSILRCHASMAHSVRGFWYHTAKTVCLTRHLLIAPPGWWTIATAAMASATATATTAAAATTAAVATTATAATAAPSSTALVSLPVHQVALICPQALEGCTQGAGVSRTGELDNTGQDATVEATAVSKHTA